MQLSSFRDQISTQELQSPTTSFEPARLYQSSIDSFLPETETSTNDPVGLPFDLETCAQNEFSSKNINM
jgi:hypothetical protein